MYPWMKQTPVYTFQGYQDGIATVTCTGPSRECQAIPYTSVIVRRDCGIPRPSMNARLCMSLHTCLEVTCILLVWGSLRLYTNSQYGYVCNPQLLAVSIVTMYSTYVCNKITFCSSLDMVYPAFFKTDQAISVSFTFI